ncbi:MAG: peptidoglycan recognition protein family protein, partial [Defluviitaleaceae bacterium]|nr:peptidoglycan recognition protein family protein [Defluviitaleaceae bacterium]
GGRQVCVHAFIGRLADGRVASYQTLPWEMRGWHAGSGANGSANETHIGFEICEAALYDAAYFGEAYAEAVGLCAHLCQIFGIDPEKQGAVISHSEGFASGIASNHADVMHWFPVHGKDMDAFRHEVAQRLGTCGAKNCCAGAQKIIHALKKGGVVFDET